MNNVVFIVVADMHGIGVGFMQDPFFLHFAVQFLPALFTGGDLQHGVGKVRPVPLIVVLPFHGDTFGVGTVMRTDIAAL